MWPPRWGGSERLCEQTRLERLVRPEPVVEEEQIFTELACLLRGVRRRLSPDRPHLGALLPFVFQTFSSLDWAKGFWAPF